MTQITNIYVNQKELPETETWYAHHKLQFNGSQKKKKKQCKNSYTKQMHVPRGLVFEH